MGWPTFYELKKLVQIVYFLFLSLSIVPIMTEIERQGFNVLLCTTNRLRCWKIIFFRPSSEECCQNSLYWYNLFLISFIVGFHAYDRIDKNSCCQIKQTVLWYESWFVNGFRKTNFLNQKVFVEVDINELTWYNRFCRWWKINPFKKGVDEVFGWGYTKKAVFTDCSLKTKQTIRQQ
jgi:hypothetical protein